MVVVVVVGGKENQKLKHHHAHGELTCFPSLALTGLESVQTETWECASVRTEGAPGVALQFWLEEREEVF